MTRTGLAVSEKQTFIRLNHLRVWGFLLQLLALNTLISSPSLFLHSIITLFMIFQMFSPGCLPGMQLWVFSLLLFSLQNPAVNCPPEMCSKSRPQGFRWFPFLHDVWHSPPFLTQETKAFPNSFTLGFSPSLTLLCQLKEDQEEVGRASHSGRIP